LSRIDYTEAIMKLSNLYVVQSVSSGCRRAAVAVRAAAFALLLGAALPVAAQTAGSSKFIPTLLVYYGGAPALVAADAPTLAKFDLIDIDRFRYNNIGSSTWAAIKAINPNVQIYLYEMGAEAPNYLDSTAQLYLNGLGRYNVSRGLFMGSLNGNHPELFLLDSSGNRIYNTGFSNVSANQYWHLMDFGSSAYQTYWVTAVKADIVDQPWVADGVFVDNCLTLASGGSYSAASPLYPTNAAWSGAMQSFVEAITTGMHGYGQKLWCNRGESRSAVGSAAWLALDNGARPPDVVLEEGAFAVMWGSDTQFYPEPDWKLQIDTLGAIRNSKVAMMSHTMLMPGQSGTDNWGKPVSFWQTLWYSLGSFLLSKNDTLGNAYFMFNGGNGYNQIWWFNEYDQIDLGKALGAYTVASIGGVNVYSREFEKGYVYVNPTANNVASIALPQASLQLTHDNLLSLPGSIPLVNAIALNGHNAAVLLKSVPTTSTPDTQAPSVPTGLSASAVSASQINLTWNASTDNVAVTSYQVYLNNVMIANTAATSFQHTGLTPSTTYNYRVSAADAVPNYSAWTATPVSVNTLPAPASQAPATEASTVVDVGHCFIATAAYGSPMARDVRYLRAFRDQYLLTNKLGQWFVEQYYRLSPALADKLRAHDDWRAMVRFALSPLVALSKWLASGETFEKQTSDRP